MKIKSKLLVGVGLLSIWVSGSVSAHGGWGGGHHHGGYHHGGYHHGGYHHGGYYGGGYRPYYDSGCAPQVQQNNVAKVDELVSTFVASPDMEKYPKFTKTMNHILSKSKVKSRMEAYLALVDVKNPKEIVYFISATKEERTEYAKKLVEKTDLTEAKALQLINELASTMTSGM